MLSYAELPPPPSPLLLPSRAAAIRRSRAIADLANDYLYSQSGHLIRVRRNVCQMLKVYRECGDCPESLVSLLVGEKKSVTERLRVVKDNIRSINVAMAAGWGLDGAGRAMEEDDDE